MSVAPSGQEAPRLLVNSKWRHGMQERLVPAARNGKRHVYYRANPMGEVRRRRKSGRRQLSHSAMESSPPPFPQTLKEHIPPTSLFMSYKLTFILRVAIHSP